MLGLPELKKWKSGVLVAVGMSTLGVSTWAAATNTHAAPSATAKPATAPAAPVTAAVPAKPAPGSPEDGLVTRKLKAALFESEAKLGDLEPWQKKIFEEEAIPQYQRFIRNYHSTQTHSGSAITNLEVDIDMDSLKNYLKFYAPKTLGRDEKNSTALLYLRAEESCEKCVAAGPAIRKLAQARAERRGLVPVWLTAEDLGAGASGTELSGKALDDKIVEMSTSRAAAAALVMQWGPAPVDDVDSAHADEKHFVLHTLLFARGLAGTGKLVASDQTLGRAEGTVDLLEGDSFENAAGRLLSDAFVALGAQAQQAEIAQATKAGASAEDGEIDLDVSGLKDFAQLGRLKTQIQGKLPTATLEEREITRGRVVLAVMGEKAAPDVVKGQLVGLALDPASPLGSKLASGTGPASVLGASSDGTPPTIALEIRP